MDIIAWECDYPHSDSIRPNAPEFVHAEMAGAGVPDGEMHQILRENTTRFFGLDPFRHITREDATVGALRALSPDVDITIRSERERRKPYDLRQKARTA